ncbi:tyrosine-type recombinase/integrase [Streptomyces sp. C36]|uniref:tyrosine-type recombinase/integrase n=1 Tax=Streptomyces sp. C36 TaxID=3237122 RepID=UPI0034C619CB
MPGLIATCREWLAETHPKHPWPAGQRVPDKPGTPYQYGLTMVRIAEHLDPDGGRDAAEFEDAEYAAALRALWGDRAEATWNRNRQTVLSFLEWARDAEYTTAKLPARCRPRTITVDTTKAVDTEEDLSSLWDAEQITLRERALWRPMYESAARASTLLGIDVPHVDLKRRRARSVDKGGHVEWLHFEQQGTDLLEEYIGDRTWGPVYLTVRKPWNWRTRDTAVDLGPGGGYRLSYDRAEEIFKETSAAFGIDGTGDFEFTFLTLHQKRHSRLTHLAEEGWDTPMLQALSHHKDPRTLHKRYTNPSPAAVQRALRRREQGRG